MLSEKISQLDEEEITEDDLAEVDKEKQEEAKEMEAEGKEKTAKENLKASAKAKLISGEALTEDEANTIVL